MEQERAVELALQGKNIFLTGEAGTGKTYTLNIIIKKLNERKKVVARTATTGIAATHIDGQTIHSWSKLGIKNKLTNDDLYSIKNKKIDYLRISMTDVLIIDEISMLSDYSFENIEHICRFVRGNDKIFGGLQVIVCGDFFQLPPVISPEYQKQNKRDNYYCFNSPVWNQVNFATCYLQTNYRQSSDPIFKELLNSIRNDTVRSDHYNLLKALSQNVGHYDFAVDLFCKNIDVNDRNNNELKKIQAKEYEFHPIVSARRPKYDDLQMQKDSDWDINNKITALKKSMTLTEPVRLKIGAKVMLNRNESKGLFVNGTLGTVIAIGVDPDDEKRDDIVITVRDEKTNEEMKIKRFEWKLEEFNDATQQDEVLVSIKQYPIKLAWSITVHKSQGATFNFIKLNLSDVFAFNMGYVALSRSTSLDGIFLSGFNEMALEIDPIVREKDIFFREESKKHEL